MKLSLKTKFIALVIALTGCNTQSSKSVFDRSFEPQLIASNSTLAEGPAVDPEGNIYFSDQAGNKVSKIDTAGNVSVFLHPAGVTNGIAFDNKGKMLLCQSGADNYPQDPSAALRRIIRVENKDSVTVLANLYNGKRFIAPNDICVDKKGRIYFTDPYYGKPQTEKSQPVSGVYRIDPSGEVALIISDLQRPNGILITPDQSKLYVSDRGTQQLHQYDLSADGEVSNDKVIYDFSPDRGIDGMCMDQTGLIYGAAGEKETTGVYVIDPIKGEKIDYFQMPETAFNVAFTGKNSDELIVASGGNVFKIKTVNKGIVLPH